MMQKKSNQPKKILIGASIAIVVTVFFGYNLYQNYFAKYAYVSKSDRRRAKEYTPLIKETVKSQLGVTPKDITYDVNPDTKELIGAIVKFSAKDVVDHPFLNSDYFYTENYHVDRRREPKFEVIVWNYWPNDADLTDIIAVKVNEVPNEVLSALIKKGNLGKGLGATKLEKTNTQSMFKNALTKKQAKVFFENYERLSKLKNQALAKELSNLKLVSPLTVTKKVDKKKSTKNMAELVKNGKFYVKNLRMITMSEPKFPMDVGSVRPFVVATSGKKNSDENTDSYFETGELFIYDTSSSNVFKESKSNHYTLYDVLKKGPNKYHAWMTKFDRGEILTFEVEIQLELDAKGFE